MKAYAANMIELHAHPSQFAEAASNCPVASPLARLQIVMQREGKGILAREVMKVLADELEQNLVKLARLALLVA